MKVYVVYYVWYDQFKLCRTFKALKLAEKFKLSLGDEGRNYHIQEMEVE